MAVAFVCRLSISELAAQFKRLFVEMQEQVWKGAPNEAWFLGTARRREGSSAVLLRHGPGRSSHTLEGVYVDQLEPFSSSTNSSPACSAFLSP